jgi:hypothetical protein
MAYLTRAAGITLLLALLVSIGWRRNWKQLGLAGSVTAVVVGGWWLWGRFAASHGGEIYSGEFLMVDPYTPELGYVGPGALLARIVNNIRLYSVEVLPQTLAAVGESLRPGVVAVLVGLLFLGLALIAWGREIRRFRVLELFTFFYSGLIFIWPQAWTDRRFLLPLLPVLLVHTAAGVTWAYEIMKRKRPAWAIPALAGILVLLTLRYNVVSVTDAGRCRRQYEQGDALACYPTIWRAFVATAEWVRDETPPDAIVVNRKPRLFYYYAHRRADIFPFTTDDEEMLAFLDDLRADYVVVSATIPRTDRYLVPVILSRREHFEPLYGVGQEPITAYVFKYRSAEELEAEEEQ